MTRSAELAVLKAAETYVFVGSFKNRKALEHAVFALREAQRKETERLKQEREAPRIPLGPEWTDAAQAGPHPLGWIHGTMGRR